MRVRTSKEYNYYLFRFFNRNWTEFAYAALGRAGLQATIEFPSDWHEDARAWVRLGFGFGRLSISFPWKKTVPDHGQCSGPTYGFQFFEDLLWIKWGKDTGNRKDKRKTKAIYMPWHWDHKKHEILTQPETHPYKYTLKNGTVQERTATIYVETRLWTRYWLPWRLFRKSIDVQFDKEVGERSGSWKGGCYGCGYDMKSGETPLQTLRRMEIERKF